MVNCCQRVNSGKPYFCYAVGYVPNAGDDFLGHKWLQYGGRKRVCFSGFNMAVSMAKSIIPDKVRIPAYIVIIATFVTLLEMIMKAYVPALYESLGIFIPLIVVNCIVLARAEAYASKHSVIESGLDGLGIGLGFTTALTMLGSVRELLGTGKIFGLTVYPSSYGALIFILAPGAFIVLGYLIALFNRFITKKA